MQRIIVTVIIAGCLLMLWRRLGKTLRRSHHESCNGLCANQALLTPAGHNRETQNCRQFSGSPQDINNYL